MTMNDNKNPADYNIVDISKGSTPKDKYFCSYRSRSLFVKNKEDQEYTSTFYNILYYPKHFAVKKETSFDLPGPETDVYGNVIGDSGLIIAVAQDPNKQAPSTTYKNQDLTRAYKALEKAGFKFTSYEER